MNKYMHLAINEARIGIKNKHGGPFGAVIVKNGKIVATSHNRVLINNDPKAHGEIMAIRNGCKKLGSFDLSGCELYTTGEPCPMCLCACMWANIKKIYYGCTIIDNEEIGFRDKKFDDLIGDREKIKDYMVCVDRDECLKLFEEYKNMDKELY